MSAMETFKFIHADACKRSSPSEQILLNISYDCACNLVEQSGRGVKTISARLGLDHYTRLLRRFGAHRYNKELRELTLLAVGL